MRSCTTPYNGPSRLASFQSSTTAIMVSDPQEVVSLPPTSINVILFGSQ